MALTVTAINAAKSKDMAYKLTDGLGLYLLVKETGGRLWRMNYSFLGKQKTLSFGSYPEVSLAKAREKRTAAREALADGQDPPGVRKAKVREAKAKSEETFKAIADEWLARLEIEGRAPKTLQKMRWLLDLAYPLIGNRPIADLTAPELLEVLRTVEVRGRYETANRLRSTFGTIFRYAIVTGRAQRDVAVDLRGALITPKPQHRAAILEPKALGGLLRAVDAHDGQPRPRSDRRRARFRKNRSGRYDRCRVRLHSRRRLECRRMGKSLLPCSRSPSPWERKGSSLLGNRQP